MASPFGHALAGWAIGRWASPERAGSAWLVPACALLAVAPDLDFVPGWIAGQPALYHQGISHSFFVGALAAGATALLIARGRADALHCFGWLFAAYASHLAIDWLAGDTRPPIGMPLLWPLSDATFLSPVPLLPGISHSPAGAEGRVAWLASLIDGYNAWALGVEMLLSAPLLAFVEWRRRRGKR